MLPDSKFRIWRILALEHTGMMECPKTPGLSVRAVGPEDAQILLQVNSDANLRVFEKRVNNGNVCRVGLLDGMPVCYGWVLANGTGGEMSLRRYTDMHVDVSIGPQRLYLWDLWTAERWRGRAIMPSFVRMVRDQYPGRALVSVVSSSNWASLRAFEKMGFGVRGRVVHMRLFGRDVLCGRSAIGGVGDG